MRELEYAKPIYLCFWQLVENFSQLIRFRMVPFVKHREGFVLKDNGINSVNASISRMTLYSCINHSFQQILLGPFPGGFGRGKGEKNKGNR